jgi:hypothetical protein
MSVVKRTKEDLSWALCWQCGTDYSSGPRVLLGYMDCGHIICYNCVTKVPVPNERTTYRCPSCSTPSKSFFELQHSVPDSLAELLRNPDDVVTEAVALARKVAAYRSMFKDRKLAIFRGHIDAVRKQNKLIKEKYTQLGQSVKKLSEQRKKFYDAYSETRKVNASLQEKLKRYLSQIFFRL